MFDMPKRCPVCGQDYQIEPGFYLAAMWVSYPIVIALIIGFIAFGHWVLGLHMLMSFAFATLLLTLLKKRFLKNLFQKLEHIKKKYYQFLLIGQYLF
jgi:uncharacterized protein (DUF983 family)